MMTSAYFTYRCYANRYKGLCDQPHRVLSESYELCILCTSYPGLKQPFYLMGNLLMACQQKKVKLATQSGLNLSHFKYIICTSLENVYLLREYVSLSIYLFVHFCLSFYLLLYPFFLFVSLSVYIFISVHLSVHYSFIHSSINSPVY